MLLKFVTRYTRKKQTLFRTVSSPNVDIIARFFFNEVSIDKNEKRFRQHRYRPCKQLNVVCLYFEYLNKIFVGAWKDYPKTYIFEWAGTIGDYEVEM